jgi:hypothetical protein
MNVMTMIYHVVTYTGPFGFIKPWTAVRDGETFSQPFLTPSIIEGMREKLGVSAILRHRLAHAGISKQQEAIQSAGFKDRPRAKTLTRSTGILTRGVMLAPVLHLAFPSTEDAGKAAAQHLCLCRNEDLVYPASEPRELSDAAFDALEGFELRFADAEAPGSFLVGYNRFADGTPMYGRLDVVGNPATAQPLDL